MRIATWNINGMKARLQYLQHWLREVSPDIVGLQELKMTGEQFPVDELRELGYHAAVHGQKAWNGVAILSKSPGTITQAGLPGQDELGARLISVDVDGLSFTTVYCPNGKSVDHDDFARKLAWFDSLAAHMADKHPPDRPAVLCGDFNVVPSALDSWSEDTLRGRIFHTDAERSRIQRLFDGGVTDLFRAAEPEEPGFTWWDYRAGAFHKKKGLRIDLILGTAPVAQRASSVTVERKWRKKLDGLIPSDHAPVWVDLTDIEA